MKKFTLTAIVFFLFGITGIFNTQAQVIKQYADTTGLSADIKNGVADIYELTSPGAAYTWDVTNTNNLTFTKNAIVRAASNMLSKPIIKLITTSTSTTPNIFYTVTPDLTISIEGIEFDGINTSSGATQPVILWATSAATNTKLYIKDCYIHDFKNQGGNGVVRLDGISTNQVLDVQNSTFNACGGRILYNNAAAATPASVTNINLKNNTFSNTLTIAVRGNVVYNSQINGGTQTIDHCTFYNIAGGNGTSDYVVRTLTNSTVATISNSIFINVVLTLNSTSTRSYCYLNGFATPPSGTNTFPATPAPEFKDAAKLDFTLTNKASFVCADGLPAGNTIYYPVLPKLGIPTVADPTIPGLNGFTVNFGTVPNATAYIVNIYLGTNLYTTKEVSGTGVAISGLLSGQTYTYTVAAKGDGNNYSNSEASQASTSITTLDTYASNSIITNLGDGSWGNPVETLVPYNTYSINGFDLDSTVVYFNSLSGPKGEFHTNRLAMKASVGKVTLPSLTALEQIEIHARFGTVPSDRFFQLQEFASSTNTWNAVGTYQFNLSTFNGGLDSIYTINISRTSTSKFRIANTSNGVFYVYQIIARNKVLTNLSAPVINDAKDLIAGGFTASWTPVANSTGYIVSVFNYNKHVKSFNVPNQSTNSYNVQGLDSANVCTYKIAAVGDGLIYSDSYLSAQSASFSITTGVSAVKNPTILYNIYCVGKEIYTTEIGKIELFNLQGVILKQAKNTNKLMATNLISGLYMVKFTDQAGKVATSKVLLQ